MCDCDEAKAQAEARDPQRFNLEDALVTALRAGHSIREFIDTINQHLNDSLAQVQADQIQAAIRVQGVTPLRPAPASEDDVLKRYNDAVAARNRVTHGHPQPVDPTHQLLLALNDQLAQMSGRLSRIEARAGASLYDMASFPNG